MSVHRYHIILAFGAIVLHIVSYCAIVYTAPVCALASYDTFFQFSRRHDVIRNRGRSPRVRMYPTAVFVWLKSKLNCFCSSLCERMCLFRKSPQWASYNLTFFVFAYKNHHFLVRQIGIIVISLLNVESSMLRYFR